MRNSGFTYLMANFMFFLLKMMIIKNIVGVHLEF